MSYPEGHRGSAAERIEAKIERIPFHSCWEWVGAVAGGGYGTVRVNGKMRPAHRALYELTIRQVGELELDHLCRNRACVRPSHLEAVTHRENILRGTSPSAQHAKKTHCPKLHVYAPGRRVCLICRARVERRRRARIRCALG